MESVSLHMTSLDHLPNPLPGDPEISGPAHLMTESPKLSPPLQSSTRSVLYLLILSTRSSGGVTESTGKPIDVDQRDTLPAGAQRVTVPAPHRCTSLRVADDADDGVPDLFI